MRAIPYAQAGSFAGAARRTAAVRAVLAAALVALVLAAAASARSPQVRSQRFLPPGTGGIVVLDLSASISSDTYARIGQTLRRLVRSGGRYGLVVFSDIAYEALPVGSPSAVLAPLVRYFTLPPQAAPGVAPSFPTNPWSSSFTSGTRISSGLGLAREVAAREHVSRPAVLLVSDLADDPGDVQRLTSELLTYRQERIPLRVVALNPAPDDAAFFRRLLANATAVVPSAAPGTPVPEAAPHAAFPTGIVVAAALVALLLAANELRGARLRWGTA